MLEPTTISVPNLAVRWNQTPADILEYAANLRLHLLFNFDGLVFDCNDDWLPSGKDWRERREFEALTDFVKRADAQFKRRRNGQLSQWESLDSDEAVSLRAEVTARNQAIEIMNEMFNERDRKRQQKHYRGALMALPATVDELLRLGFAKHPIQAYRPEGPFTLHTVDGVCVLDGPVVRLEPARSQWKERLEPADMLVSMADVKAIEAAAEPQQTAPAIDTAPPAPVAALGDEKQSIERIRYEVLASRSKLIEAFGHYGVELKIFKALKDRPGLLAACRVKGKGQKGSRAEPMFCPFEVINWLVKTGVKEKPKLENFMGWHILETKFPSVYAEKSIGDPRQN